MHLKCCFRVQVRRCFRIQVCLLLAGASWTDRTEYKQKHQFGSRVLVKFVFRVNVCVYQTPRPVTSLCIQQHAVGYTSNYMRTWVQGNFREVKCSTSFGSCLLNLFYKRRSLTIHIRLCVCSLVTRLYIYIPGQ